MRRALLMSLVVLFSACGAGEAEVEGGDEVAPETPFDWVSDSGEEDLVVAGADTDAELGTDESDLTTATPQTVFVNFSGPLITACDNCSDARSNKSWVMKALGFSKYNFAPYTDKAGQSAIVSKLKSFYGRYNVRFTTTRPTSGAYTMVVISASTSIPHHGVGPLDCGNKNRNDIVFVYKTGGCSADLIAREAAHELGHSFGLTHVLNNSDFMQWASSGRSWTKASYDSGHPAGKCFSGSVQDAPAMLKANLGLHP